MTVGGTTVTFSQIDFNLSKPTFRRKTVAATLIPDIVKCSDERQLVVLSRDQLQQNIKDHEMKKRPKQPLVQTSELVTNVYSHAKLKEHTTDPNKKHPSLPENNSVEDENHDTPANFQSCQQKSKMDLLYAAQKDYEEKHTNDDVYLEEQRKFLQDSEKRIKGKPHYRLLQKADNSPVGFIYQRTAVRVFKKELEETDDVYHVIQALLYAGKTAGYKYCDYLQISMEGDISPSIRVWPDKKWQETNVQKAHNFCAYYDSMWEELKSRYCS